VRARTEGEARWWIAAGAALAAIYASLYPAQLALDWLRARDLLRRSLLATAVAVMLVLALWMLRRRSGWREWAVLGLIVLVYVDYASGMTIVQERFHLLEYGGVALLFRQALTVRWRERRPRALAIEFAAVGLASAGGWVDELIQWALPNRHYDLRDVATNAVAATLAITAAAALAAARREERAVERAA
jgi:VanZ family protein